LAGVDPAPVVVLISARAEWVPVRTTFPDAVVEPSPYGEWFGVDLGASGDPMPVVFLHGGWGKIAAAGSAQYAIDRWAPTLVVNIGTCGGFGGAAAGGAVVLADRTLVHDIVERMGDQDAALRHYTTALDLGWLPDPTPSPVVRGMLLSGDQDIDPAGLERLLGFDGAVAADWEAGAIAYVAARNRVRCLVLRGVSDVVAADGGEAYGDGGRLFVKRAATVMRELLAVLPAWIAAARPVGGGA
jgi:adenosylhomocysteine nucleosidase